MYYNNSMIKSRQGLEEVKENISCGDNSIQNGSEIIANFISSKGDGKLKFQFNDGGRVAAGYKGAARDCVVRSIAIAAEKPYSEIYATVQKIQNKEVRPKTKDGYLKGLPSSPRSGVKKTTTRKILSELGWKWTPTMGIGTGCKVHLREGELPMGRIIASVSHHLVAVIDGVINDTHDCSREGTRCVYGYYTKEAI